MGSVRSIAADIDIDIDDASGVSGGGGGWGWEVCVKYPERAYNLLT